MSGKDKRKRAKNTSTDQYELYLQYMQNDYIFRSGTINPTVNENYIENKWDDLCSKLYSMGDGPVLSVGEWKKRFNDWKYALRSKYRNLESYRRRTGSGPESDIKLFDLEMRALSVWGKVVVTGTPNVTDFDGISTEVAIIHANIEIDPLINSELHQSEEIPFISMSDEPLNSNVNNNDSILPISLVNNDTILPINLVNNNDTIIPISLVNAKEKNIAESSSISKKCNEQSSSKKSPTTPSNKTFYQNVKKIKRPFSEVAQNLLDKNEEQNKNLMELNTTFKKYVENYIEIEKAKLDIKREKLNFEIKKYKYENKDFDY